MIEKTETTFKSYAIFDMDGTLIDSMPYWENLTAEFLQKQGVICDLIETLAIVNTMTVSESADYFVKQFHLNMTINEAQNDINEIMSNHYRNDIPLKQGMLETLQKLKADGVGMCVVSATEESLMDACLKRLGILDFFAFTLSCETYRTHKRDPWIFLKAAEMLGTKPEDIVVYEDSLYALKTAKQAGFQTVAVYDHASDRDWKEMVRLADSFVKFD